MFENIKVLISEEEVSKRFDEIAQQINTEYAGKEVILVCILKGSVYITCEISKRLDIPVKLDFMAVSSYGDETTSSGNVIINKDLDEDIEGKDIIIVEDIIDSGRTLFRLSNLLKTRKPASMKIFTLLDKPDRREKDCNVLVDYVGFKIPDVFVVGYGLDWAQKYRNLRYVGVVENNEKN